MSIIYIPDGLEKEDYISGDFTKEEVDCSCGECSKATADVRLVRVMQTDVREYFNSITRVHSWFRCRAHNNRPINQKNKFGVYGAGSNDNSWHLVGGAVDFHVEKVPHEVVAEHLRDMYPECFGIGLYVWGVHLDIRNNRADW